MDTTRALDQLQSNRLPDRLNALKDLADSTVDAIDLPYTDVNNHIHTRYSFSPYYPAQAAYLAKKAGCSTAGIMDHDSVGGANEFVQAGDILSLPVTVGTEIRVSMKDTAVMGRRINNPDQDDVVYMAIHGIADTKTAVMESHLARIRAFRNQRNRAMLKRINDLAKSWLPPLDFDTDVLPSSLAHKGGSVTERHLLFAFARRILDMFGPGRPCVDFLQKKLCLQISEKNTQYLLDETNEYYEYDLLGALKSEMVERFYIRAEQECPPVKKAVQWAEQIGAIAAYAYLGDVSDSVTGDKKQQKFEDDYLDELFLELKKIGFHAVTYMPSRNTAKQLVRVKDLCVKHDLMQISGEDINSPRQSFICESLRDPRYKNLIDSAYALVAHETLLQKNDNYGLFSKRTRTRYPNLEKRIALFADWYKTGLIGEKR